MAVVSKAGTALPAGPKSSVEGVLAGREAALSGSEAGGTEGREAGRRVATRRVCAAAPRSRRGGLRAGRWDRNVW